MALVINDKAGLITVDSRAIAKQISLPFVSSRPGRVITIKDSYGFAHVNPITIVTSGSDFFEKGTRSYIIKDAFALVTLVADGSTNIWRILSKSDIIETFDHISTGQISSLTGQFSSISTTSINSLNNVTSNLQVNFANINYAYISSLSVGVLYSEIVSTSITQDITNLIVDNAYISTAEISTLEMSNAFARNLSVEFFSSAQMNFGFSTLSTTIGNTSNFLPYFSTISTIITSSIIGLGTLGYVSSTSLLSTVAGLGSIGYISSMMKELTSTVSGLGSVGYLSTIPNDVSRYLSTVSTSLSTLSTVDYIVFSTLSTNINKTAVKRNKISIKNLLSHDLFDTPTSDSTSTDILLDGLVFLKADGNLNENSKLSVYLPRQDTLSLEPFTAIRIIHAGGFNDPNFEVFGYDNFYDYWSVINEIAPRESASFIYVPSYSIDGLTETMWFSVTGM